jgi:hypothetical protein
VAHYHGERNHQGLDKTLIKETPRSEAKPAKCTAAHTGGLLNFCKRAA